MALCRRLCVAFSGNVSNSNDNAAIDSSELLCSAMELQLMFGESNTLFSTPTGERVRKDGFNALPLF